MKNSLVSAPADVPRFLMNSVSGFVDSPEYQRLDRISQSVPGLVVGQLGILLRRLQAEALTSKTTSVALRESYDALEVLASSPSREVQNLVVVDVLEHLHATPEVFEAILKNMGPATGELYREWVEPQDHTT